MKPLFVIVSLVLTCSLHAQDDGMPFGKIGEADVDRLEQFAKKSGFDWRPEMKRMYEKDEGALARFFKFSLTFSKLDDHARAYGQVLYSSLLNLGEQIGVEAYVKVLDRQSPEVQQRVRDFLYYPMLRVPKEHRKEAENETRKMYPTIFPVGFQFGRGDPIFADTTT
ncbi:MAG: hypothetical protein QOH88_2489 [Verrucomicrobiota bacterium]|jgi:hypothetical protein